MGHRYIYKVRRVVKVVDGDTLDIEIDLGFGTYLVHRVRLKNVNAPETRTSDFVEKAKGLSSKDWLTKELAKETSWKIETFKDDKYGRFLGILFVEGETKSLNERMIEQGMALPFMVSP